MCVGLVERVELLTPWRMWLTLSSFSMICINQLLEYEVDDEVTTEFISISTFLVIHRQNAKSSVMSVLRRKSARGMARGKQTADLKRKSSYWMHNVKQESPRRGSILETR